MNYEVIDFVKIIITQDHDECEFHMTPLKINNFSHMKHSC